MKFKYVSIMFIILSIILTMSAVSAQDINGTDSELVGEINEEIALEADATQDVNLSVEAQDVVEAKATAANQDASFGKISKYNYMKGNNFFVRVLDADKKPIVNKTVKYTFNGKTINSLTNENGYAGLSLNVSKGTYTVKYTFDEKGYNPITGSAKILVLTSKVSKINAPAYNAYTLFKNTFTATLTVDGIPLENRAVNFTVHGKTYQRTTNAKGVASLAIGLRQGVYPITVSYAGETNINKASASTKITVTEKMPKVLTRANDVVYEHITLGKFKVKLTNARGGVLSNLSVTFTVNSKSYVKKTDSNGIATLDIKLRQGSYSIKVSSSSTKYYTSVSKTFTIKVKSSDTRNNGFWLFGRDMNSVNLNTLKSYGTKHIFLNFKAIDLYGKSGVESFIQKANGKGIKVHIWMQVFYDGSWHNPVKNGKIDYDLINSKIKLAKSYTGIKGISGIHMDYLRYPGTAYKYSKGVEAINYFTEHVCTELHNINPDLIVSAAVMPEVSANKYYYGQDIPTMTKYLDVIVPMIYKGNYGKDTSWIQKTTQAFVKQSSGAQVWSGLQSYKSDSNPTKLSAANLMKDADAASLGGATGVILFRWGLVNYIDFNDI